MREHCRAAHRWVKASGLSWVPAQIQTFFAAHRRRYYEVKGGVVPAVDGRTNCLTARDNETGLGATVQALLEAGEERDVQEARDLASAESVQQPADSSPWLQKTRWLTKFAGCNLRPIAALSARPVSDEGTLQLVWASVHRVLDRCQVSISSWHQQEEDGDVVLSWLNSPQIDSCNPQPFSTHYERSTHMRYAGYWARCLCYFLRLVFDEHRHGYSLSSANEQDLRAIWEAAELEPDDQSLLDRLVFDFSVQLWMHKGCARSKSAIVHFTAVLGIDGRSGAFRLPAGYGQILAALLYCARLLLFEYALPIERRDNIDDRYEAFIQVHHQWLVDGQPTPFHYTDNLLAYCMGAGKGAGGKPRVQWSADQQTLIYQGQRLPLAELRRCAKELCSEAEDLLYGPLTFTVDGEIAPLVRIESLVDDMNESAIGYSFLSDRRNRLIGGRERMLRRIVAHPLATLLLGSAPFQSGAVPDAWRQYCVQLNRFLTLLFLLVHLCGGAPARGVEILPIRHMNTAHAPRNIFAHDGQILVVTGYHKSQALTRRERVIARLQPHRISRLIVTYLADVLPLVTLLDPDRLPASGRSFLWVDSKGVWKTPRVSKALSEEMALRTSVRINIQDYRHIAKAIDREHVRRPNSLDAYSDGEDSDKGGGGDNAHDLAFAHSTDTAEGVYAIDSSMLRSLTSKTLRAFRIVSHRWHDFWALPDIPGLQTGPPFEQRLQTGPTSKQRSQTGLSSQQRPRTLSSLSQPVERSRPAKRRMLNSPSSPIAVEQGVDGLQRALERLLRQPGACFRSQEQEDALQAVCSGVSPLVVILPPGAGKSLLFQLPASLPDAGTTIVVLPFQALSYDLVGRCRSLGLTASLWIRQQQTSTRLVFVSAEAAAMNDDFLTYASTLQADGRLDRIVIDECHVPLIAASYRQRLVHLDRLRAIPCPLLLLTGTLPPKCQEHLEDTFLLGTAGQGLRYIRTGTDRPHVQYRVEITATEEAAEKQVHELMQRAREMLPTGQRAIAFCRSRASCERLARRLDCQLYHRSLEEKEESLSTWIDRREKVIVATSALGTGVDIAGIQIVIHLGRPHGIIDFVQEVGRAGRTGEPVQSTVVAERREIERLESSATVGQPDPNYEGLRQFLTEQHCRRARLSAIMDGQEIVCHQQQEGGNNASCDLCQDRWTREAASAAAAVSRDREAYEVAAHRAKEQEQRYSIGPQLWQARVRQQAVERQALDKAIDEVDSQCVACWFLDRPERSHATKDCPVLQAAAGGDYRAVRRSIQYEKGSYCCFLCRRPGDWCLEYSQHQRCTKHDVVTPLVLAVWGTSSGRAALAREVGSSETAQLVRWMGRLARIGGTQATNAVRAAVQIIQQRSSSTGGPSL
jgi:superfamily II DNA helicase RecQ